LIHFYKRRRGIRLRMSAGLAPRLDFSTKNSSVDLQALDISKFASTLSEFQVEKLTYFFDQFFDSNHDGTIRADDLNVLNGRLRKVSGWSESDPNYLAMVDNNRVFLECLLDQVKGERTSSTHLENRTWEEALAPRKMTVSSVSLSAWLNMWGRLCQGSAGIDDFPIWVQLIPRVMFNVMVAKEGSSVITRESLRNFYINFTGIQESVVEEVATDGFRVMSANGDYELTLENYKLLFSNFLLGRTIYGPGKYIFGCFDNRDMTEKYQVVYQ